VTYATTTSTATATAATTATTSGAATASRLGSLVTLLGRLGLASELDRDLAVKDGLAVQLTDGTLGLRGGRDVNEGVANGTSGAGVGGDGSGLTAVKVRG
jgi:hypothetical protein